MIDPASLATAQLGRMRGMTALYHKRFFADTRFIIVVVLALFAGGLFGAERLYLAVAPVAVLGAAQTAFDASYLIFARHYAARLEAFLNRQAGTTVLVAAHMEDAYLFPLHRTKVVTLAWGSGFTWFGFMTGLYTLTGIAAYAVGLVAAQRPLVELGGGWPAAYYLAVGVITAITLAVGAWWFVSGVGERRLREVLDTTFAG